MDSSQQKRAFIDFLDQGDYMRHVDAMLTTRGKRLLVSLDDLRGFDAELTRSLMKRPAEYLPPFEEALREVVAAQDPTYSKTVPPSSLKVGLQGSFGAHHVSPRGLTADFLNSAVCVEGIVTKCSLVRPKVTKSTHYCAATSKFSSKEYRDLTSLGGTATGSAYPTKDADGNLLTTEYGLCEYIDHQLVTLQEMPERAPPGQLPRSIEILLEGDLCDRCKPGDRVQISGIHRALPSKSNSTGMFRTLILGNHLRPLTRELAHDAFTREDLSNIKGLAKDPDVLQVLARSLAPSICGHAHEKVALLLMLLGGSEKNLANGTHLRGDINILMLGDPSTAKSQLLRFVLRIAPLAVSTTGRGSSGVGLTAAVTKDDDTGDRRLEAGAMVLADRGVCCVDEFDKMTDADRVAIHEVMEQQTVTISKAGIHASLNARCSVVAAANPVYGKYDMSRSPMQNIGLPDSLLSRFDLLFIILDKKDADHDRLISKHVLRMHGTRGRSSAPDMVGMAEQQTSAVATAAPMYAADNLAAMAAEGTDASQPLLSTEFVKKFITYAKSMHTPKMGEDAATKIAEAYADLRERAKSNQGRTLPITARTLETMIRLSAAHAKAHLRSVVIDEDADAALALMHYAIFSEDREAAAKDGLQDDEEPLFGDKPDSDDDDAPPAPRAKPAAALNKDQLRAVIEKELARLFASHEDDCPVEALLDSLAAHAPAAAAAGPDAVQAALEAMEADNSVMVREGRIHMI